VRFRKEEEMKKAADALRAESGQETSLKILTSCPSCLQGLARFTDDVAVDADYIVVEIAKHVLGEQWLPSYVDAANHGGIERVLV
jgi:Fe-S oxidoreductase